MTRSGFGDPAGAAPSTLEWRWQTPQLPASPLTAVALVDDRVGWAVGWGGAILRTTDGGATLPRA